MATLLDHLQLLRACSHAPDDAFRRHVAERFRAEYLRLFEADKQAYLQRVLDEQFLSGAQIAALLGYGSRSAINAIRNGTIAHDKFELVAATLGAAVPWPSAVDRRTRALITTVDYVQQHELKQPIRRPLDLESLECLEQALSEDIRLRELEFDREQEAWLFALFRRVKGVVDAPQITTATQLHDLLREWGPAYTRTKFALHSFLRDP